MPIYFLLYKYRLNHGLIWCLSNRLKWVDLIWCYSDQRESSRNIFDSNLELSQCDSNLCIFCAQFFNFETIFALIMLKMLLPLRVFDRFTLSLFILPCHINPYTLIWISFFKRYLTIFLLILLSPTLFILWGYTIPIHGNVCNVI